MAQPAQANPFAVPPPGDPTMQQQQSIQQGSPFGSFAAQAPAPAQTSDPFSIAPAAAAVPNGSAVAPPPQQQPAPAQVQPQQVSDPWAAPVQAPAPNENAAISPPQQQVQVQPPQPQQQAPPQFAAQQPPFNQQGMQPQFSQQQGMQQQATQPQFSQQPQQQQMQPPPQQQAMAPPPQFAQQAQPATQPVDPFSNALVPSTQPSSPYAQSVAQPLTQPVAQQANPFGGQAMVPVAQQQQSQWAVPGAAPATGAVNPFDPFAPAPTPPPAPAPPVQAPPPPAASTEIVPAAADFPFDPDQVAPPQEEPKASERPGSVGPPVNEVNAFHGAQSVVSEPETTLTRRSDDRGSIGREMVVHQPPQAPLQNKYSQELARNAPPGCAPLPKGELVAKSGYILSRISFRTILMKKWKQSYWVQYGRHTMLWFRSENHFNEWLNNPYLSQAQRNFLVKLAINFVHDLYKPNVRGYQVTQCHTKPYGRKLIRQFKLERWMDYGPTIAAAFGSQDQREVDDLRQTIIDCMRNTPLENGIRATGAVRQDHHENHNGHGDQHGHHGDQHFSYDDHQPPRRQRK